MEFVFASDRLYPVDRTLDTDKGGGILVERDTLICYDVMPVGSNNFMGASTWEFKVRGHGDVLYRTHYAWALVQNTPENIGHLRDVRAAQQTVNEWQKRVKRLFARVADASHLTNE
jgi:hypothetical protein